MSRSREFKQQCFRADRSRPNLYCSWFPVLAELGRGTTIFGECGSRVFIPSRLPNNSRVRLLRRDFGVRPRRPPRLNPKRGILVRDPESSYVIPHDRRNEHQGQQRGDDHGEEDQRPAVCEIDMEGHHFASLRCCFAFPSCAFVSAGNPSACAIKSASLFFSDKSCTSCDAALSSASISSGT
jgi:hypothetical protein